MKEFSATVYETWFKLFNQDYNLIFSTLFDDGVYANLVLSLLFISFLFWALFYYFLTYPYGTFLHWIGWLIISALVVAIVTYSLVNAGIFSSSNQSLNDALADSSTGYADFGESLPMKFAFYNGILTLFIGFIYSMVLKQFSKIQVHLPF